MTIPLCVPRAAADSASQNGDGRWPAATVGRHAARTAPDDVAERVRICLRHVPADKLFLTTDCGPRYVHRTLAREKITNLVTGVRMVRAEL